jgi:hypothetical protein
MPVSIFIELGIHTMPPETISMPYFISPIVNINTAASQIMEVKRESCPCACLIKPFSMKANGVVDA